MDLHFLAYIQAIDRDGTWQHDAVPSMEYWISVRYGITIDAARDELSVARVIGSLPAIAQAYGDGLLSKQKLVALCSFVEPEGDEFWALEAQKYGAAFVRRAAGYARRMKKEEAAEVDKRRELHMDWDHQHDVLRFRGVLPGADGALFKKSIERLTRDPVLGDDGEWIPLEERRADALADLAATRLGEDQDTARATVVVHVDARDLNHVHGMASLEDGPLVPSEVARRLACDGYIQAIVEDEGGKPLGIGRRSRVVPKALLWKLRERDRGCVCCGSTFFVATEAHHMIPWSRGGRTDLSNLVIVCRPCHRLIHERGYDLYWRDDGTVEMRRPDGHIMKNRPTPLRPDIKARMIGPPNRNDQPARSRPDQPQRGIDASAGTVVSGGP
jgi:hypothetical protein